MKIKYSIFIISIFHLIFSCKSLEDIGPKIDVATLKTEKGNAVDSPKSTTITASGATINVPLAGAKIIVPAGAMSPGSVLITQTITDKLDNDGNGLRISGDFLKPFIVEFSYPSDEKNPENLGIGIQSQNGNWYMLKKYVVNKTAKTIGFSIYPRKTKNARLNGTKLLTNDYDLAFAKQFYLRAEKTEVDLGESVNIKAYARQGVIPNSDKFKEYQSEWANGNFPMNLADYIDSQEIAIKNKDDEQAADPDKLFPLVQVAQEYLFTNKKEGYRRSWILTEGIGSLEATGNIGAKYAAPKTNDAKGKIAVATFYSSLESDLKGGIEASVKIRIKDGLTRYAGTVKITKVNTVTSTLGTRTTTSILLGKITLVNSLGIPYAYKHEATPKNLVSTQVVNFNEETSDGETKWTIIADNSPVNDGGLCYLDFTKDYKTYKIDGSLNGVCTINKFCAKCTIKNSIDSEFGISSDFFTGYNFKQTPTQNVSDINMISGKSTSNTKSSNSDVTITTEWNFQKVN